MKFVARGRTFDVSGRPLIMGVLNVTPDSFYDGGRYSSVDAALKRSQEMLSEGADIIDVGGESTRPGAEAVSAEEEAARVVGIIEKIVSRLGAVVSVDTYKPAVAAAAVAAGASIINDIYALGFESAKIGDIAAASAAGLVLMHMKGTPRTMQTDPVYTDVVGEIKDFLAERVALAESKGVKKESIAVDPGIGFGKTAAHNVEIIRRLAELSGIGATILVGASRKSFLGKILGDASVEERLSATLAAHLAAYAAGARILRVHDVAAHVDFFKVYREILG